jgi:DNA-binding beta-propeller fold protein YncE
LSTANDISTASYDNVNFNVSSQEGSGRAMCFSGDGLHFYIGGSSTDSIFQYDMTTAFDVSTASYSNYSLSVSSQETTPASLGFNTTGTKMFVMGYSSDKVHSYDLSSAYDLSTASYNNVNFSVSSQETTPYGFAFNKTGSKMYVVGTGTDKIYEYDLSTEFDLSTCSYNNVCSGALSSSTNPVSIYFSADARKMFIQTTADAVYQYST